MPLCRHKRIFAARDIGFALLITLAATGCAGAQDATALPDARTRQETAFAVREAGRSRVDSLFTQVTGIDVDSRGRIYAGDWFTARVVVLDSTGAVVRTVGRRGLGPGEFRSVRGVQVLPGDSLLVYDPGAARLSVFAPDSTRAAYVTNLAATLAGPEPHLIRRTPANDAHIALIRPPFTSGDTARHDLLRLLSLDGSVRGEPMRRFPSRSFLRVQQQGGFSVMPNPFGHEGLFALGPDGTLHYAWNGTLGVESTDLEGTRVGGFALAYEPPPVTSADAKSAFAGMPEQAVSMFRDALRDSLPERWPALLALLVDERGRLWVGLHGAADEPREWALFEPGGRYLGSAFLPREAEVHAVRGDRFYTAENGDDGVTAVVVYHVVPRPEGGNG
ncbi:hypothetical protein [Longimicrobium sp.]|uniref:hypothetical protein n=1 Tax=Longimicrobium sp. TaxID=2029185 RepID=UPI003B3A634D